MHLRVSLIHFVPILVVGECGASTSDRSINCKHRLKMQLLSSWLPCKQNQIMHKLLMSLEIGGSVFSSYFLFVFFAHTLLRLVCGCGLRLQGRNISGENPGGNCISMCVRRCKEEKKKDILYIRKNERTNCGCQAVQQCSAKKKPKQAAWVKCNQQTEARRMPWRSSLLLCYVVVVDCF